MHDAELFAFPMCDTYQLIPRGQLLEIPELLTKEN